METGIMRLVSSTFARFLSKFTVHAILILYYVTISILSTDNEDAPQEITKGEIVVAEEANKEPTPDIKHRERDDVAGKFNRCLSVCHNFLYMQ